MSEQDQSAQDESAQAEPVEPTAERGDDTEAGTEGTPPSPHHDREDAADDVLGSDGDDPSKADEEKGGL